MNRSKPRRLRLTALGLLFATMGFAGSAHADAIVVTYSDAKQVSPLFASICGNATICDYGMENFAGWGGGNSFSSTFSDAGTGTYSLPNGASFNGAYTAGIGTTTGPGGEWQNIAQNEFGGVSGQKYPELFGPANGSVTERGVANATNYNLALTTTGIPGINYFGLWISALDPHNDLKFYDGSSLVAELDSAALLSQLGNCKTPASNPFCGNPTAQFQGQDSSELFVYVNVFDLTGYFTDVDFFNSGGTGFESTNDAVGYAPPPHVVGTQIGEPASLLILLSGLSGLLGVAACRTVTKNRAEAKRER